jgi:hypothetical protein
MPRRKLAPTPKGIVAKTLFGVALASLMWPTSARASVLSGCVAPEDAGVTHLVGWVDVGVMLGMADPEPPASLQVTDPNGGVIDYRDGLGLITPTDVLPIWFAPAELVGTYEMVINGEERCTVHVDGGLNSSIPNADEISLDRVPHSVTNDEESSPYLSIVGWEVRSALVK